MQHLPYIVENHLQARRYACVLVRLRNEWYLEGRDFLGERRRSHPSGKAVASLVALAVCMFDALTLGKWLKSSG